MEAAGVVLKSDRKKKDKNVVKVKEKDVRTKSSKNIKDGEESISFNDPELDDIDNIDYDDDYDKKK